MLLSNIGLWPHTCSVSMASLQWTEEATIAERDPDQWTLAVLTLSGKCQRPTSPWPHKEIHCEQASLAIQSSVLAKGHRFSPGVSLAYIICWRGVLDIHVQVPIAVQAYTNSRITDCNVKVIPLRDPSPPLPYLPSSPLPSLLPPSHCPVALLATHSLEL